jgi:hypothetical protein
LRKFVQTLKHLKNPDSEYEKTAPVVLEVPEARNPKGLNV